MYQLVWCCLQLIWASNRCRNSVKLKRFSNSLENIEKWFSFLIRNGVDFTPSFKRCLVEFWLNIEFFSSFHSLWKLEIVLESCSSKISKLIFSYHLSIVFIRACESYISPIKLSNVWKLQKGLGISLKFKWMIVDRYFH